MTPHAPANLILTGSDADELRRTAFDWAADHAGPQPESVLYLAPDTTDAAWLRDQWRPHATDIQFAVLGLDDIVDRVYDRSVIASTATYFTRPHHRQAVESALHTLGSEHPFAPPEAAMSNGHLQQLDDLLTLTEFAGLNSATAISDRLRTEGLPELAADLRDLKTAFETARNAFADGVDRSLRSERYATVTNQDPSDVLAHVDVVLVGEFSRLSPVEAALLEWFTAETPTYAIASRFTEDAPTGIDRTLTHLWETYTTRLNLTPQRVGPDTTTDRPIDPAAFGQLYHPSTAEPMPVGDALDLVAAMDVGHEARHIMRRVQSLLTEDDVDPTEIGIVVTDTGAYLDPLAAAAADRNLAVQYTREQDLDCTRPGAVLFDVLDLLSDPADDAALAAVLTSPCTTLATLETDIQATELGEELRVAIEEDDQSIRGDAEAALLEELREHATEVAAGSIDDLESIRTTLGLTAPDEGDVTDLEAEAWESIDHTIEVVSERPTLESRPHWVPTLRRAFTNATVSTAYGGVHDSVHLQGVLDETERTYEHVFIAGLTQGQYPSGGRRLAFTRRLNEAHRDFDRTNPDQRADHRIASLIASARTATLTRPRTREDGSEYIPAGVLQELQRHTTLEPSVIDEYGHLPQDTTQSEWIGSSGDTWRALGVLGGASRDALTSAHESIQTVLAAYLADTEAAARSTIVSNGFETSTSRALSDPDARNGWLDSQTVTMLDGERDGSTSPSELETYAACGFKHYASYLLELEAKDEDTTSADQGTIVHEILDRFYTSLQGDGEEPVDLSTHEEAALEARLFEVATDVLSETDDEAAVSESWKRSLLAGLATEDENPYYDPWGMTDPVAGTLARFLAEERTLRGLTDSMTDPLSTRPVSFERYLRATVDGNELHGKVDRIDVTPDGEFIVRDYKTGYTPSADDILDGLAFQLPVYLQLAAADLDKTPIGGTYYQVAGPNDVSSYNTVLASGEDAAWHATGDSPLRRHNYPRLDTRDEFERFLTDTIPDRIDRILANIESGYFHPTVNEPDDAGCSYCEYSEICDVRANRRHSFIEALDETPDEDVYVPLAARDEEYDPTDEAADAATGGDS